MVCGKTILGRTSGNPSFRVTGFQVTDNPENWINLDKPKHIFDHVLMKRWSSCRRDVPSHTIECPTQKAWFTFQASLNVCNINPSLSLLTWFLFWTKKRSCLHKHLLHTHANLPSTSRCCRPSVSAQRDAKRHALDPSLEALFAKEKQYFDSD